MAIATKKRTSNGAARTAKRIVIPSSSMEEIDVTVEGMTPLVVNMWSEKARRMMRDSHLGKPKRKPEAKKPVVLMQDTLYRFKAEVDGTAFGFPAVALKKATVRAFKHIDGKTMSDAKGFMHIYGEMDVEESTELVPIFAPPVTELNFKERHLAGEMDWTEDEMLEALKFEHKYGASLREDDVRVGMGTADIRYRAQFTTWKIAFTVRYHSRLVSHAELITAIDDGGQLDGIGEGRPGRSGHTWGTYRVKTG